MKTNPSALSPVIRQEVLSDFASVFEVVTLAFATMEFADGDEQFLVEKLRQSDAFVPELSLVAEVDGRVVGHIILTKIRIGDGPSAVESLTLAPVSVLPEFHKQGIGSSLIREAHRRAAELGYGSVVVIGHPDYYPRFGYQRASHWGITFVFEVPDDVAMAVELTPGALNGVSGVARLSEAFGPEYT